MNHSTSSNVPCFCLRITSKRCSEWCWVTEQCHRRQEESVWLSPLQCRAISCCLCVPVRPGRRCLRGATFDISGVWIFSQSVHVLHVIVLWLREHFWLEMCHSMENYFRQLIDTCLKLCFLFYLLASSFTFFTPLCKVSRVLIKSHELQSNSLHYYYQQTN